MRVLKNAVNLSHDILKRVVKLRDVVLDATCGKGNDTVFLAELVGDLGKVYSFDVQMKAIDMAKDCARKNGVSSRINFICDGHENLDRYLKDELSAVIFNLGYLPTGDHSIATKADTTIVAIQKSLKLIKQNGLVVLVVYSGGDTGFEEKEKVLGFVSRLDAKIYNVMKVDFVNQINNPPVLVCIEKL